VKKIDRENEDSAFSIQVQRSAYVADETWYYDDDGTIGTDPGPVIEVACKVVIMANGLWVPNKVPVEGIELATGYEELPSTGESFADKAVTVLGMGNAALETANAMVCTSSVSVTGARVQLHV
jgi:cation diffusion facilitator CzcD-associated flavoprotein CzcO